MQCPLWKPEGFKGFLCILMIPKCLVMCFSFCHCLDSVHLLLYMFFWFLNKSCWPESWSPCSTRALPFRFHFQINQIHRPFSKQTFWLQFAGKSYIELITFLIIWPSNYCIAAISAVISCNCVWYVKMYAVIKIYSIFKVFSKVMYTSSDLGTNIFITVKSRSKSIK